MGYSETIERKLDIFDKNNIEILKIKNVKKLKGGNLDLFLTQFCFSSEDIDKTLETAFIKNDNNRKWLYSFNMNGSDYIEYEAIIVESNGNSRDIIIGYKPLLEKDNNYNHYDHEYAPYIRYIGQRGECPVCGKGDFNVYKNSGNNNDDNIRICNECGNKDTADKFYWQ